MATLPDITCPECMITLVSEEFTPDAQGKARTPNKFGDCLRRCEDCGIGVSNTKDSSKIVYIYREPLRNIPEEVRNGAIETLNNAFNKVNRNNKLSKFCSENSEDAVTWTIFKFLAEKSLLQSVFAEFDVPSDKGRSREPVVLLWGVPVPLANDGGHRCALQIETVLNDMGENSQSRSEPDVILDYGDAGVVFIEVKLKSENETKQVPDLVWNRYLKDSDYFNDSNSVRESRLYELARNWRIGCQYAGSRPFTLINLGPSSLFSKKKNADALTYFSSALKIDDDHQFIQLKWPQLMHAIQEKPQWLLRYDYDRGLSFNSQDLVRPIIGRREVSKCLNDLQEAHNYLQEYGKHALNEVVNRTDDLAWGINTKRIRVQLPNQGKPYLVPYRLLSHNLVEVINQCATLERLIDVLRWSMTPVSGLSDYFITKCHPTSSSDKGGSSTERDHDLVLEGPDGKVAYFEVSDVVSPKDKNRKEIKDLINLGVLSGKQNAPSLSDHWPEGRLFLVVSSEFEEGLLSRKPKWIGEGHCQYKSFHISESTRVLEILKGDSR